MRYMSLLNRARKEATKSNHAHRIGACLYKGGSVLATGFNKVRLNRTGLRYTNFIESVHAERDVCSKVNKELIRNAIICVVRVNNQGGFLLAKPCPDCMELLTMLGVKRIVYSISTKPFYKEVRL